MKLKSDLIFPKKKKNSSSCKHVYITQNSYLAMIYKFCFTHYMKRRNYVLLYNLTECGSFCNNRYACAINGHEG